MALTDENDEMWTDSEEKENIALLNLFRLKQPFSLLMAAKKYLSENEFKRVLKTVIMICFRYNVICDRNPNDQETPFNMLAQSISLEKHVDLKKLSSILVDDNEFKSAFKEKSFPYNSRNAKVIKYILGKIEHFKGSTQVISFNDENISIEHIYPQNPNDEWELDESKMQRFIFRLGNMCLLEKRLNRDVQNASYLDKIVVYQKSAYYYAQKVAADYSEWNDNAIIKLQSEMANSAISIWRVTI